jgi:ABC-type nitrate/sulfonate/bicarbonate transport system substrate-binding protein
MPTTNAGHRPFGVNYVYFGALRVHSINLVCRIRIWREVRCAPETLDAFARGYLEGVAAAHADKDRAIKVIQKYTRLKEQKLIDELYGDSVKFLERVPRVEPEAIAPIVEFMGKKPIAVETIADNSIVDRLVREGFIDKLDKLYKRR